MRNIKNIICKAKIKYHFQKINENNAIINENLLVSGTHYISTLDYRLRMFDNSIHDFFINTLYNFV